MSYNFEELILRKIIFGTILFAVIFVSTIPQSFSQSGLIMGPEDQQRVTKGDYTKFYDMMIISIIIGIPLTVSLIVVRRKIKKTRSKNQSTIKKINEIYTSDGLRKSLPKTRQIRLPPKKEVIYRLLQESGNRCNLYPCSNSIDYYGCLKGHLFPIMSNEKEQTHFNPHFTAKEVIKFKNLMLICDEDYFDVDVNEKYTIEELMQKKTEALESPNRDLNYEINSHIVDELIQRFLDRYPYA
jgi:hypothetical protein